MTMRTIKLLPPAVLARKASAILHAEAPKAVVRRLLESDLRIAFALHAKWVRKAPEGAAVVTRSHAGAVANSYGYKADCDRLEIRTEADGLTMCRVWRGYAPTVSGGHGGAGGSVRVIKPGQIDGTVVA